MTDDSEGGDGCPADDEGIDTATRHLLDSTFDRIRAGDPPKSLFDRLTPLYRDAHREEDVYDRWDSTVQSTVGDAESVLVLDCGVGGLAARLAEEYPSVLGVDRRPELLRIARERTDVPVAAGSPTRLPVRRRVDAIVGFGHVLTHAGVDPGDLFRALRPLVRPGGCVVVDAAREARTVLELPWADEVAGYGASCAVTAGDERREVAHLGVEFEVSDTESGESALASQQLTFRLLGRDTLRRGLTAAGFEEARVEPFQGGEGGVFAVGRVERR
jgi:SAM-dependent methyltransferase